MRPTTKAASAGSIEGGGKGRGLFGGAVATRGASGGSKGSGARSGGRLGSLLAVLALAAVAAAFTASPASATPPVPTVGTFENISYTSAKVSGTVIPDSEFLTFYEFEYSTDEVNWSGVANQQFINPGGPAKNVSASLTGLLGGTQYFVRLKATTVNEEVFSAGPNSTFTTLLVAKPTVLTANDASTVFSTSATASGEVERPANPNTAFDASCHFEYVTDDQFTANGFESAAQTSCDTDPLTTPGATTVTADLAELTPATTYHLRLTASNAGGPDSKEAASTFTTLPAVTQSPTIIAVEAASEITNTTAKLLGSIERPAGADPALDAQCHFEYVTDATFQPRDEEQGLTVRGTGGTFTLTFEAQTTAPIAFDASAASVQAALEGLPGIGAGAIAVSGGPGDEAGSAPYAIAFGGALAAKDVEAISVDPSSLTVEGEAGAEVTVTTEGRAEGFSSATQAPCDLNPVTEIGATSVSTTLSGLAFGTKYHFRLTASNGAGSASLPATTTFTTTASPRAQTLAAGGVQADSATLAAQINPLNAPVTYQFEWGAVEEAGDTSYENKAPVTPESLFAEDESFHVVTTPLTGLSPATVYHFRIVATNTQTNETEEGIDRSFTTLSSPTSTPTCSNESSRAGPSAGLPDCRAYELATPGTDGAPITTVEGEALPDGNAIWFNVLDAPDHAEGSFVYGAAVARRGASGWATKSLVPPTPVQSAAYLAGVKFVQAVSRDFSQTVVQTDQPLAGPGSPSGLNMYLHRADGSFVSLTKVGMSTAATVQASSQFTHIFIAATSKQAPADPADSNVYEWVNGSLRLVGILPGAEHIPAPEGVGLAAGALPAFSRDGDNVLFREGTLGTSQVEVGLNGPLYLREHGERTVDVSASQRTVSPDPNPLASPRSMGGINADGSEVLFVSSSELTNDANTGTSGGVPNDAGADLYSYNVQSEELTDLTTDDNPADSATGANVTHVSGATPDASFIYFIATGGLAPGAISGQQNLYVEHGGVIDFIAPAEGLIALSPNARLYVTPDGHHAAFTSRDSLTGYDNTNPDTGNREAEVFEYTYGGGLECASCRPSGVAPNGGASIVRRAVSEDGSRVFFQSSDAVMPQATNGLQNIYEYEAGQVHLLTTGDGEDQSNLLDASASGDDVFIQTHDELTPGEHGTASATAIFDARVNADTAPTSAPDCLAEACLGAATAPPNESFPGSAKFQAKGGIVGPSSAAGKGSKLRLRLTVPGAGELKVSGNGLRSSKKQVKKPGSVTVLIALKPSAARSLLKKGAFKTKTQILFKSSSGDTSRDAVALRFEAPAEKGGK